MSITTRGIGIPAVTRKRVSASLAIGSALAAIGLLGGPAPVQARPAAPPPLAPACTSWQFPGGPVTLLYPPVGKTVFDVPAGTHVVAPGQTIGDNGSPPLPVHVVGDILGHSFTLTVNRDNFEPLNFIGQIRDDNKAHGFYQIGATGPEVPFQTAEAMVCQPGSEPAPEAKPTHCTGLGTAPPGKTCQDLAAEQQQAKPAPTDAVTMTLNRSGLTNETATFSNSSDVSGQCHYDAQDVNGILPGKTDDFPIGANKTVTRTYPAPPPLTTYHAVVSCTGDFNGQNIEFGHAEQDVSG